jgi:hypothetical protein
MRSLIIFSLFILVFSCNRSSDSSSSSTPANVATVTPYLWSQYSSAKSLRISEDFSDDEAEDLPLTQTQLNNLLGLHFDDAELQMAFEINPNLTYQQIVDRYYQTAQEDYNLNLPVINNVIQAEELSNILDTHVEKRDVATQTIEYLFQQNAGRRTRKTRKTRRTRRTRKTRKTRKNKKK